MFRSDTPTARLRAVAALEGISYLVLLFIAMPLKYLMDMPMAVRVTGSIHGALFVLGGLLVYQGIRTRGKPWSWGWRILIAALIPFGTFFLDRELREDDEAHRRALEVATVPPGTPPGFSSREPREPRRGATR